MRDPQSPPLYCHVCGSLLTRGALGHSEYEYSCGTCLAAYHIQDGMASYLTPAFVEHGEPPVVMPVHHLYAPEYGRHDAAAS